MIGEMTREMILVSRPESPPPPRAAAWSLGAAAAVMETIGEMARQMILVSRRERVSLVAARWLMLSTTRTRRRGC